jgi:hypothetical protein
MDIDKWTVNGVQLSSEGILGYPLARSIDDLAAMETPGNAPVAQMFANLQPDGMQLAVSVDQTSRTVVDLRATRESLGVPAPGDVTSDTYSLSIWANSFNLPHPITIEIHRAIVWGCGLVAVRSFGTLGGNLVYHQAGVDFRDKKMAVTTVFDETLTRVYDSEFDTMVTDGRVLSVLPESPDILEQIRKDLDKLNPIDNLPREDVDAWYEAVKLRNEHRAPTFRTTL